MSQLLKVDEWQSASKRWYVADVHTWTGWDELADIFCVRDLDSFCDYITGDDIMQTLDDVDKIVHYPDKPTLVIFYWDSDEYKWAHKFKLDVNRIARQKGFMV